MKNLHMNGSKVCEREDGTQTVEENDRRVNERQTCISNKGYSEWQ